MKNILEIIYEWINQFDFIDADLYVINDGFVSEKQLSKYNLQNKVKWINLEPVLGRKSLSIFPGFCRSFAKGLEISLQYKSFALVENDLKVLSKNKFNRYLKKDGIFTGYSNRFKMIESSFMIINNIKKRRELFEFYNIESNQYSEHWVEKHIEKELNLNRKNFIFIGERYEGNPKNLIFCKDYIAQYFDRGGDKSDVRLIVSIFRLSFIFYPLHYLRKIRRSIKKLSINKQNIITI